MGPVRAAHLESPDEVERRVRESTAVIARSERLVDEYNELLGRAERLLAEQKALVKKFRRERRARR
ncbi:MAG TPA: hypothetical protein VHN19_02810 [Burkholderiales bacterium]|jgi:hypothetical protein|nr:hypothetical protein [Burkholderiales bacterium]